MFYEWHDASNGDSTRLSKLWDMWLMDIREMIERQEARNKTGSQPTRSKKLAKKRRRHQANV